MEHATAHRLAQEIRQSEEYQTYHALKEEVMADETTAALLKEYKKLQELICRNEEKLQATMTDEQKDLFEKYADCVQEYQTITDCLIFQNSFKLGARMMLEIMEE